MEPIEIFKILGASFGYILSAIVLITMIKNGAKGKIGGYIKKESETENHDERLDKLEETLSNYIEKDNVFQEQVLKLLETQKRASKQTLAHIIEDTYHRNKTVKTLDPIEFKRIVNAYDIYHNECGGNSYITEIYEEMMDSWDRL